MFVALPLKVDAMLPRANLARVEPNRSGPLSRGKGISMCCALSVETIFWCSAFSRELRKSVDQQPHAAAALRCWTATRLSMRKKRKSLPRTNTCARQPRAIDTRLKT
jgi:hypothetical protein